MYCKISSAHSGIIFIGTPNPTVHKVFDRMIKEIKGKEKEIKDYMYSL